jgi:hypothetical protein
VDAAGRLGAKAGRGSRGAPIALTPIIDWLCTPGLRCQVCGRFGEPSGTAKSLADQLHWLIRNGPEN